MTDTPKDNAAGWKIITDDAKTAGRILLLWVPTGGLGEHVELGYWSAILDKWVNTYGKAFSAAPDRWATLAPFIDSAPPQDNADDYRCPICAEPLKASDICASDITEGTCHAECLAGSPVVDLDTGDEIPGCKIDTYPYREVMEPPAAYRCDTCGAHIVAGACDCTKMQRPVLIGNDKPAPKDNMAAAEFDPDPPTRAYVNTLKAEIAQLRTGIKRLSDEEELCAETTGDDPFSMVHLAAKLAAAEHDLTGAKHVAKNALSDLQYWRSKYEELSGAPKDNVTVKAIEWEAREDSSYRGLSAIGYYHVFPGTGFSYDLCGPVGGRLATYKRLEEAKAAAQTDYTARVLSALAVEPPKNRAVVSAGGDTAERSGGEK